MNTFGKMFRVTVWGESHGKALGAVVDGCPSNLPLTEEDIQKELDRRRPGYSIFSTPRKEPDEVELLSGTFEGKTTGAPISALVYNKNQKSKDYNKIKDTPRPGHADYTYGVKYGNYDYRGGGRSSGRTTIGHVIGGAIAKKLLDYSHNIKIIGYTVKIGKIEGDFNYYSKQEIFHSDINDIIEKIENNPLRCPSSNVDEMKDYVLNAMENKDSVGGIVELVALNVPAGVGNPIFGKLNSELAGALMGVNAVKGVEIGRGFESAELYGSEMNDEYYYNSENNIQLKTNNCGGILGGISCGAPIVIRVAIKPTPSISKIQHTVNVKTGKNQELIIGGRHDPIIVPRAIPVLESMVAITLSDLMIRSGFIHPCRL
ncbi:chorismate synthase [Methanothermococcus okinawensis]|uniref:Chorismate synthase n=1 Tax=Methanothermococcus okinawensis (strain DSM 14208 / JCM 11175 / IH1) TaxID=647113 RepID=F8ANX2_METOI|nr:chorismate synthase [Methanothermococcus okinawensis]AEH07113.1 chorismate synthase [Methanothermococcus okinawensis IH1]